MTRLARNNRTVDYPEVLPEVGCFGFRHEKAGGSRLRLIQVQLMETIKTANRQPCKTVRIVTDLPVLVQSENTLTRKGRGKPIILTLGTFQISLSLTDSGEAVVKVYVPP